MAEYPALRLLVHLEDGPEARYREAAESLLAVLRRTGRFSVELGTGELRPAGQHVVLAASDHPVSDTEAAALQRHLHAGGGVVAVGSTLSAWSSTGALAELVGWQPGAAAPASELRVRPVPEGPISARLDPEILLRDRLLPAPEPPPGAEVLLTVPWRLRDHVVAFRLQVGAGRLVYLGLGQGPGIFALPEFQGIVHRCLNAAAGIAPAPPIGVGLYGYGAIGREHAESVSAVEGLELRGICDRLPERRLEAARRHGAPVHADLRELLRDPSVELVVVGVPPVAHCEAVLDCLAAGRHVVCEKPFALRGEEADRMTAAATEAGRVLTVYQSRRWDPDYLALRQLVRTGAIGHVFYMESFIGGFSHPCSYWHSHEPVSGGTIFDWGSHYFDWMLQLIDGEVVRVTGHAHKRVWHDVTNADQVRVELVFAGGEEASFLQSDVAAVPKPKWYLLGTAGAIVADWRTETVKGRAWTGDLVEDRLAPAESPARLRVQRPDGNGGVHVEVPSLGARPPHAFYRNLADHLLLGGSLAVPPEEARRNVAVMVAADRSIAQGGRQVEVRV